MLGSDGKRRFGRDDQHLDSVAECGSAESANPSAEFKFRDSKFKTHDSTKIQDATSRRKIQNARLKNHDSKSKTRRSIKEPLMLQLISLVMLIYSYFLVRTSIPSCRGSFRRTSMPRVWPTAGEVPTCSGSCSGAQALTCAVFLVVPYIGATSRSAVHFGSRRLSDFPPAQRARAVADAQ